MTIDVEALAGEAGTWLEDETADFVPGSFADVVRRASAHEGSKLTPQDLDEAEALDECDDEAIAAAIRFGTLDDFLDDAAELAAEMASDDLPPMRALIDRMRPVGDVAPGGTLIPARDGHTEVAVGDASAVNGEDDRKPRVAWLAGLGGLVAVAAVLVGVVSLGGVEGILERAGLRSDDSTYSSAVDRVDGTARETGGLAEHREPVRERKPRAVAPPEPETEPEPEPVILEDEPEVEAVAEPEPPDTSRPRRTKAERLAALDEVARAAWKAGDLAEARKQFEALVRSGGKRRAADIAYGDLFSLARQLGDDAALRGYWTRYAKTFPRGRYIDEVRAGLCRTAKASQQRACWEDYLRDRPQGTYRKHARDALARGE